METLPRHLLARVVRQALLEDIGPGDLTTDATVPAGDRALGIITAGEPLVVAGLEAARLAFVQIDPSASVSLLLSDGARAAEGEEVLRVEGSSRGILSAERTALNFLGRLSGIATLARRCVDAVAGTRAQVFDTRKTTPGLRLLERHAVATGGARNHRSGLYDAILIKDNHLVAAGGVPAAVEAARRRFGSRYPIEVEVESLEELEQAIDSGADIVLLDNMPVERMREAVTLRDERATAGAARPLLEASGGIGPSTVSAVAATGVDRISMGALTHSAPSAGFSLTLRRLDER